MHIERLVTMANDIAAFFLGSADRAEAARGVATHLRSYWDPRMRKAIIEYCKEDGAGLNELAREAVGLLADDAAAQR
jgi:formate dehydrogenase subunit delta